ncbi:MAG: HAMP domain-containing histidine kinase [Clostridiales bacterium]|nr:HAMP domain-containing histidine kinase [Clostridiales bacterium]
MFKKVHLRLTLLCAGSTAAIMIVMSLAYLYISEQNLNKNQLQAFENDINTIATNLEHQNVITMEWLSKMEAQNNYIFFIIDNGVPFLYNSLSDLSESVSKSLLLEEFLAVRQTDVSDYGVYSNYGSGVQIDYNYAFTSPSTNTDYLAGVIRLGDKSALEIIVLSSQNSLKNQLRGQRFRFLIIDIAAILLLTAFAWFFTGRLLKPIMENQQNQIQFIASASHELRTPLAVILSTAECCRNASQEGLDGFLSTINKETLHMSALLDDMLTLFGSDGQHFPVKIQPVEMDTLVINSYESFLPLAKQKSIDLAISLPEEPLPTCPADSQRISQVIAILIQNAISYTQEGGKIELSLSYNKAHFYISVADNGIGISDEDKKKIFDRFYRAEKSRSSKEHFGLGLSIAYEIVQAHNGSITVSDAAGGGSVFTVMI